MTMTTKKALSGLYIGTNPYGGPVFTQVRTTKVYEDVGIEEIQVTTWFDLEGGTHQVIFPVDLELDENGGYDGYDELLKDLTDETIFETYRVMHGPHVGELDQPGQEEP
jgi:hypothetical protein